MKSDRENTNIAIAILEKITIYSAPKIILNLGAPTIFLSIVYPRHIERMCVTTHTKYTSIYAHTHIT